jgi:hypothetical protein
LLPTDRHTQNNKDQGRRPVTRKRERERKRERDSKRGGRNRREEGLGSAEAGRAEGQAEMKAERERKPDTRICLKSISPAEDTLSDGFINSNQDLVYQLTIKSSSTGLESGNRCRGRAVCIRERKD